MIHTFRAAPLLVDDLRALFPGDARPFEAEPPFRIQRGRELVCDGAHGGGVVRLGFGRELQVNVVRLQWLTDRVTVWGGDEPEEMLRVDRYLPAPHAACYAGGEHVAVIDRVLCGSVPAHADGTEVELVARCGADRATMTVALRRVPFPEVWRERMESIANTDSFLVLRQPSTALPQRECRTEGPMDFAALRDRLLHTMRDGRPSPAPRSVGPAPAESEDRTINERIEDIDVDTFGLGRTSVAWGGDTVITVERTDRKGVDSFTIDITCAIDAQGNFLQIVPSKALENRTTVTLGDTKPDPLKHDRTVTWEAAPGDLISTVIINDDVDIAADAFVWSHGSDTFVRPIHPSNRVEAFWRTADAAAFPASTVVLADGTTVALVERAYVQAEPTARVARCARGGTLAMGDASAPVVVQQGATVWWEEECGDAPFPTASNIFLRDLGQLDGWTFAVPDAWVAPTVQRSATWDELRVSGHRDAGPSIARVFGCDDLAWGVDRGIVVAEPASLPKPMPLTPLVRCQRVVREDGGIEFEDGTLFAVMRTAEGTIFGAPISTPIAARPERCMFSPAWTAPRGQPAQTLLRRGGEVVGRVLATAHPHIAMLFGERGGVAELHDACETWVPPQGGASATVSFDGRGRAIVRAATKGLVFATCARFDDYHPHAAPAPPSIASRGGGLRDVGAGAMENVETLKTIPGARVIRFRVA